MAAEIWNGLHADGHVRLQLYGGVWLLLHAISTIRTTSSVGLSAFYLVSTEALDGRGERVSCVSHSYQQEEKPFLAARSRPTLASLTCSLATIGTSFASFAQWNEGLPR